MKLTRKEYRCMWYRPNLVVFWSYQRFADRWSRRIWPTVARRQAAKLDQQIFVFSLTWKSLPSSKANDRGVQILTYDLNATKNNNSGRQIAQMSIKTQPWYWDSTGREVVPNGGASGAGLGSICRNSSSLVRTRYRDLWLYCEVDKCKVYKSSFIQSSCLTYSYCLISSQRIQLQ